MNRFVSVMSFALLLLGVAHGETPLPTAASFAQAQATAKTDNKLVLLLFKSFQCSHCKAFQEKVLDAAIFRTFADKHLVMMIYDIAKLDELTEDERAVERELEDKHLVASTPTILVFSPSGEVLLRTEGYAGSSAEKIVVNLNKLAAATTK